MGSANNLILDSSNGNASNWMDISKYGTTWSLHAISLEAGASLKVYASNASSQPLPTDPTGVLLETIPTASGNNVFWNGATTANWLQVVKVPGGSPTETFVRIFASAAS
jgi:hypothetical protein